MAKARKRPSLKGAKNERLAAERVPAPPVEVENRLPPDQSVISAAEEILTVGKRVVDTGRGVRVSKTVLEKEHVVNEPLNQDELQIQRVAINRYIDRSEIPSIRQEEDVTVVPIFEEVLVTEKRLLLKEEVRITRVRHQVHQPQRVVLRSEQVSVEHFDEKDSSLNSKRKRG